MIHSFKSAFFYLLFLGFGAMASYDYATNSKWTLWWILVSAIMLAFAITSELEYQIKKIQK